MKKVVSLVVFLILLTWTWSLIHSEPNISFETHSIIQQKLAEIIQASVQKHRPNAKDFNLIRLWTETVGPDKVSAHFTYTFKEPNSKEDTSASASQETVSGDAVLKKSSGENQAQENWKVEKVQTSSNQIVFQEGESIDGTNTNSEQ